MGEEVKEEVGNFMLVERVIGEGIFFHCVIAIYCGGFFDTLLE